MRLASESLSVVGLLAAVGCGMGTGPTDAAAMDGARLDAAVFDSAAPDDAAQPCDDEDMDGYMSIACGGDDCDDTDPAAHPGADDIAAPTDWALQRIDDASADSIDVEIDESGFVHLFYSDGRLMRASDASGQWETEYIDYGYALSAALGLDGSMHIAFEGEGRQLYYGSDEAGPWAATWLDESWTVSMTTSLELDSTGNAHVAYDNGWLRYASNAVLGSWQTEEVADHAWRLSIAIGRDDEPHIAYVDDSLFYATRGEGKWTIETIDQGSWGAGGADVALLIDAGDVAHVSYGAWPEVRYATNPGGEWRTEIASPRGDYASLAIDARGVAHVAYHDPEGDDLAYATNAGGAWVAEIVDAEGRTGFRTSIRVHGDVVHIGYYEPDGHAVLYARRVITDGVDQDCDGEDG